MIRRMIAVVSLVVLTFLLAPRSAGAVACGQTISGSVTLTGPLDCSTSPTTYALRIAATSAPTTLDCDDFDITGANPGTPNCNTAHSGIFIDGAFGATVKNCRVVQKFCQGIRLYNATDTRVENSKFQDNQRYGMWITDSTGSEIFNNDVVDSGDEGIHLSGPCNTAGNNQLLGNRVFGKADGSTVEGIYFEGASGNTIGRLVTLGTIIKTEVKDHKETGIHLNRKTEPTPICESDDNIIERTEVTDDQIHLRGSQNNTLKHLKLMVGGRNKGGQLKFSDQADEEGQNLRASSNNTGNHIDITTGTVSFAYFIQGGATGIEIKNSSATIGVGVDRLPSERHICGKNTAVATFPSPFTFDGDLVCRPQDTSSITVNGNACVVGQC